MESFLWKHALIVHSKLFIIKRLHFLVWFNYITFNKQQRKGLELLAM